MRYTAYYIIYTGDGEHEVDIPFDADTNSDAMFVAEDMIDAVAGDYFVHPDDMILDSVFNEDAGGWVY